MGKKRKGYQVVVTFLIALAILLGAAARLLEALAELLRLLIRLTLG
jgi:hypothetical protein